MNYKRKLDCLVDSMNVIVPDSSQMDFFSGKEMERASKKVRISLNARVEPFAFPESSSDQFRDFYTSSNSCCGSIEDKSVRLTGGEDEEMESDIPSTSEVLESLRKVMLWMSAQEDSSSDHIEYLSTVERYALSKHDSFTQQRKITEYFIKN